MPHSTIPDEVLLAVAETPEMWPAILEWRLWFTDVKTGKVEIAFGNGVPKRMQRFEDMALGQAVELARDVIPVCPSCKGDVDDRDYGNKVYCARCDRTLTIWEIKQLQSVRARRPGEPPRTPINGLARK